MVKVFFSSQTTKKDAIVRMYLALSCLPVKNPGSIYPNIWHKKKRITHRIYGIFPAGSQ